MGKQVVPFRMADAGVQWLDAFAEKVNLTRSEAIRACMMFASECESDGRVTAYTVRQIRAGRIRAGRGDDA
jgi:hypothetical protein